MSTPCPKVAKSAAHTPPICRKQLLIKLAGGAKTETRPSLTKRNAVLNIKYQDNTLSEKHVYGVIFLRMYRLILRVCAQSFWRLTKKKNLHCILFSQLSFKSAIWTSDKAPFHWKEPKKEGYRSRWLSLLVPDRDDSCIEFYGRWTEKHE